MKRKGYIMKELFKEVHNAAAAAEAAAAAAVVGRISWNQISVPDGPLNYHQTQKTSNHYKILSIIIPYSCKLICIYDTSIIHEQWQNQSQRTQASQHMGPFALVLLLQHKESISMLHTRQFTCTVFCCCLTIFIKICVSYGDFHWSWPPKIKS